MRFIKHHYTCSYLGNFIRGNLNEQRLPLSQAKNNQTPSKHEKKMHNRKWKNVFKRQLMKWMKDPNYEIIEQSYATSAKWEWN